MVCTSTHNDKLLCKVSLQSETKDRRNDAYKPYTLDNK